MTKVTVTKRIITVPEMIKAIKEHYNLNDTLLAINLNVTNQTIKAWKEGKKPRKDSYLELTELYKGINSEEQTSEEQTEEVQEVTEVTEEKKPYEISYPKVYPEKCKTMWYIDNFGTFTGYDYYATFLDRNFYKTGLLFNTKEEAEQFLKEQTLIKKIKCWTKEQQGDWEPDWKDIDECKYFIKIYVKDKELWVNSSYTSNTFLKIPYFKSYEIAQTCIDEFGDEILEVFC